MAPIGSGGGVEGLADSKGRESKGLIRSVEVDRRRREGFEKEIKRVKISSRNSFFFNYSWELSYCTRNNLSSYR